MAESKVRIHCWMAGVVHASGGEVAGRRPELEVGGGRDPRGQWERWAGWQWQKVDQLLCVVQARSHGPEVSGALWLGHRWWT